MQLFQIVNKMIYKEKSVKTLLPYYKKWNDHLINREFDKYSEIMKTMNIEKSSTISQIGILRLSFLFRENISEWDIFVKRVYNNLLERNEDADTILQGLIRKNE